MKINKLLRNNNIIVLFIFLFVIILAVYVFHKHVALIKEGQETQQGTPQDTPQGTPGGAPQESYKIPAKYKEDLNKLLNKLPDLKNSTSDIQKIVDAFFRSLLALSVSDIETTYAFDPNYSPKFREAGEKYFGKIKSVDDVYDKPSDATKAMTKMKERFRYYHKIEFPKIKLNDNLNLDLLLKDIIENNPLGTYNLKFISKLQRNAFDRTEYTGVCGKDSFIVNPSDWIQSSEIGAFIGPIVDVLNNNYELNIKTDTDDRFKSLAIFIVKILYLLRYFIDNINVDFTTLENGCPAWPPAPCKAPSKAPSTEVTKAPSKPKK